MSTTQQHLTHDRDGRERTTHRPPATPSAAALGIGMRLSVHPHRDDFATVITDALGDAEACGLTRHLVVETDDVSTWVGAREHPAEQRLVAYAAAVVVAAHRRSGGGHVVAHVLLSRGCPGEVRCTPDVAALPAPAPVEVPLTGVPAVAQWSLYPLLDGGPARGDDHMRLILDAVDVARERGVASEPAHYATRLSGDVAQVLATAADAWAAVGARVPHVVTHLTLSVGSPSEVRA